MTTVIFSYENIISERCTNYTKSVVSKLYFFIRVHNLRTLSCYKITCKYEDK